MKVSGRDEDLARLQRVTLLASSTCNGQVAFSRSASKRVNKGACAAPAEWAMGSLAGKEGRIAPRAAGPPVETPITTTLGRELHCFAR